MIYVLTHLSAMGMDEVMRMVGATWFMIITGLAASLHFPSVSETTGWTIHIVNSVLSNITFIWILWKAS